MARKRSWERFGDRRDETTPAALSLCRLVVIEFIPDGDLIGDPATADEENREVVPHSPSLTKLNLLEHLDAILAAPQHAAIATLPKMPFWHLFANQEPTPRQCRFGIIVASYFISMFCEAKIPHN